VSPFSVTNTSSMHRFIRVKLLGKDLIPGKVIVFSVLESRKGYWANDRNSAEIDFLVDTGMDVIPIEVKAEINLQAKSLKIYRVQFSPRIAVRTAMTDYKREEGLINLPLYAVHMIREACD